jgi:CheY-like chemotaxis protein
MTARLAPHVVLLDIGLPGIDGYEVARRLRAASTPSALVALTGYGQEEDRARARDAGFDGHLTKPVEPAVLARVLSDVRSP